MHPYRPWFKTQLRFQRRAIQKQVSTVFILFSFSSHSRWLNYVELLGEFQQKSPSYISKVTRKIQECTGCVDNLSFYSLFTNFLDAISSIARLLVKYTTTTILKHWRRAQRKGGKEATREGVVFLYVLHSLKSCARCCSTMTNMQKV